MLQDLHADGLLGGYCSYPCPRFLRNVEEGKRDRADAPQDLPGVLLSASRRAAWILHLEDVRTDKPYRVHDRFRDRHPEFYIAPRDSCVIVPPGFTVSPRDAFYATLGERILPTVVGFDDDHLPYDLSEVLAGGERRRWRQGSGSRHCFSRWDCRPATTGRRASSTAGSETSRGVSKVLVVPT